MHHRKTPHIDEKNPKKTSCKIIFKHFDTQMTRNRKDTFFFLNNKECNNKGTPVTADCRCARQARRLQRRIQSHIKDTKQYCNP